MTDRDDVWSSSAAGLATGAVCRAARGVRSAAVAGALGGLAAGTMPTFWSCSCSVGVVSVNLASLLLPNPSNLYSVLSQKGVVWDADIFHSPIEPTHWVILWIFQWLAASRRKGKVFLSFPFMILALTIWFIPHRVLAMSTG
ncbi:heparan-alpha-glucosaminide N-acetyltransferase-like isoform X1 [Hibiscus syriacus]|uniref:Heparan-alpha-glucosaminide N-acetyltransferase-like isoform X1 n=1 Tax=Hibiscus syriacus TaxID=106335 RepID=A0A6A2WSD3_HIBSY|nr:heparan-alpha-glucosaminide N-acetyltransferase-like isoform X1 [Hibiscus syriacus]